MNPEMTIGGFPLYPIAGTVDSNLPIYRPEYGGGGLLSGGDDFQNLRRTFAGGLLNGMQYDPSSNRFNAIQPSGMYTTDPNAAAKTSGGDGGRKLTYRDAFDLMYNQQGQRGLAMPPALLDALGSDNATGRFNDLFGLEFDPDDEYDPSNENYRKLKSQLEQPSVWDTSR